jgi:very-short-patch-repair endonuclease
MHTNNPYNKALKPLANQLRKDSTKSEIRLWCELLSGKRLAGYGFLRQRTSGNDIVDFMCKELKLVIEIDGYSHNFKNEEDIKRDEELNKSGFTVIRFSDKEVVQDLQHVQRTLEAFIESHSGNHPPPLPKSSGTKSLQRGILRRMNCLFDFWKEHFRGPYGG